MVKITDLEVAAEWIKKIRDWLQTFEGMPSNDNFYIDYNRDNVDNAGLHPNGLSLVVKTDDVTGNTFLSYQLNASLHIVLPKVPDEDTLATSNAVWVLAFQRWVIHQTVLGKTPKLGNIDQIDEEFRAQNGFLYSLPADGAALYSVMISAKFKPGNVFRRNFNVAP